MSTNQFLKIAVASGLLMLAACAEKTCNTYTDAKTEEKSYSTSNSEVKKDALAKEYEVAEDAQIIEAEDEALHMMVSPMQGVSSNSTRSGGAMRKAKMKKAYAPGYFGVADKISAEPAFIQPHNTESYAFTQENDYKEAKDEPLSTFSIDVDNASYTNTRRFLNNGELPPSDAVRIEEFINYFSYNYPQPQTKHPFSVVTEVAECPWNPNHQLLHVGLQGKRYKFEEIDPMNIVFLLDVSGSMESPNKLPLLRKSFKMLLKKMRPEDKVAIVVYAGAAGVVLPSTPGNEKEKIEAALNKLSAGGSTAGGQGIKLAYKIAKENYIDGGVNRIILATDGDFNIGASSDGEMTRLIEEKRDQGIFLTVLGYGMGNYKDSKMESIADHGNGNYFYIDNIEESRKALYDELDATLYTIAKDVKLQLEFNPANVKGYRLIGYVNRKLNKEDFNNDKKDAGELGAGHTVTALYEIIPAGADEKINAGVDELKYTQPEKTTKSYSDELLTVKLRYKKPTESVSNLLKVPVKNQIEKHPSHDFNFSASVAGFGMLLRNSKYKGTLTYDKVIEMAQESKGKDENGYRAQFVSLVKTASVLDERASIK